MAEMSKLENQLSLLTEQLAELNTTTKEQFKQAKLGGNYNPFSSAYAAPAYSASMNLDGSGAGSAFRLEKVKGRFNPFSHNRLDGPIASTSNLLYISPQDRIRSDTNEVSAMGRGAMGLGQAGSGLFGGSLGGTAGQAVGAGIATKIGGWTGAAVSTMLPIGGMFLGAALGAGLGSAAFRGLSGTNQRVAANSIHKYMMENSFRFLNPNQSAGSNNPLGSGFGFKDSRELSRGIALMTDDTNLNVKTLMDLTKSFSEGDLMKGVNSTKDFTKRFKSLTETAKTMAYLLNDSVEDAGKFMSDLQLRGFDMSKLTSQTAKMKNLSQFLGKDVSEVTQTAIGHASNNVAGTNMDFTVALGNQTFSTAVMGRISDAYLKDGDKRYEAGYNLIKNMNGPEDAGSVLGKIMNASMLQENNISEAAIMAAAVYNPENKSWTIDSQALQQFISKGFSVGEGQAYAEKEMVRKYVSKMRLKDPNFQASPDLVYNEYFANKQQLVGSMDLKDQLAIAKHTIDSYRREAPEKLANSSDKAILRNAGFDETSAELLVAAIEVSKDGFASEYENRGLVAQFTAEQKAKNTGLVGKVKRFGAGVGNFIAGVGMAVTSPIQDIADQAIKKGSNFMFGDKDFNYQKEFAMDQEVVKKIFGDSSGYVDPSKMGENFYKEFEKGLQDAQKKGMFVSKLLMSEVSAMAKTVVRTTTAQAMLSGQDYSVQRWTSSEGLGDYAKQNYNSIQQLAVNNQISDQMLSYIGQTKSMNPDQLNTAAPELKRLMDAYGGNEILAIAAYERGGAALDKTLTDLTGLDLAKMRESKDFTALNSNSDVTAWSKEYSKNMEKTAGTSMAAWQGTESTIQSKNQSAVAEKSSPQDLLISAIGLTDMGIPRANNDSVLKNRLLALGIEVTDGMSTSEKESLLAVTEDSYASNIKNLESYARLSNNQAFMSLTKEEREKTVNAYLSKMAGKDKLNFSEQEIFASVKKNYADIIEGKQLTGFGIDEANAAYDDINSSTLKQIEDDAKAKDAEIYEQVEIAHRNARDVVGSLSFEGKSALGFEGKSASEIAKAREKIMKALYSGNSDELESLGKEYNISAGYMETLRKLSGVRLEGTDTNPLSLNPEEVKGLNEKKAQILASTVRYDYRGAQAVLKAVGIDPTPMSISEEKLNVTSIKQIEDTRQNLIEAGIDAVSQMDEANLTALMNSGLFSEYEIGLLSQDKGDGKNLLVNKDGSFSFSGNKEKEAARAIISFASEERELELKDPSKEEGAGTDLNEAASNLLTTAENTTKVMIDGTKVLIERQNELAKLTGVQIPETSSTGAGTTSIPVGGQGQKKG